MVAFSKVYPRLVVSDAARAIDFYVAAFGARAGERHAGENGKIVHAEVTIGAGFTVAVKDEDGADPSPASLGGRLADPFGHLWMISQPLS